MYICVIESFFCKAPTLRLSLDEKFAEALILNMLLLMSTSRLSEPKKTKNF